MSLWPWRGRKKVSSDDEAKAAAEVRLSELEHRAFELVRTRRFTTDHLVQQFQEGRRRA